MVAGPGGSGTAMLWRKGKRFGEMYTDSQLDVLGFDPRGKLTSLLTSRTQFNFGPVQASTCPLLPFLASATMRIEIVGHGYSPPFPKVWASSLSTHSMREY